jgi:arginyl-tRNA synthetase
LRKGENQQRRISREDLNEKEIALIRLMHDFPDVLAESARTLNPSLIANFMYELAKEFNQFYHDHSILSAETEGQTSQRLLLLESIGKLIASGMELLGIEVPERM